MKKDLRQIRPFLVIGIVLILVGVAMIVFGFMYPNRGNWLGGMVAGFFSTGFILIGLYACLKKERAEYKKKQKQNNILCARVDISNLREDLKEQIKHGDLSHQWSTIIENAVRREEWRFLSIVPVRYVDGKLENALLLFIPKD